LVWRALAGSGGARMPGGSLSRFRLGRRGGLALAMVAPPSTGEEPGNREAARCIGGDRGRCGCGWPRPVYARREVDDRPDAPHGARGAAS